VQQNRIWLCVATSSMPQTKYIATQYSSRYLMCGLVDASASRSRGFCAMLEARHFRGPLVNLRRYWLRAAASGRVLRTRADRPDLPSIRDIWNKGTPAEARL